MMNINVTPQVNAVVNKPVLKQHAVKFNEAMKVDIITFTATDKESPEVDKKLNRFIDVVKLPLLMIKTLVLGLLNKIKLLFSSQTDDKKDVDGDQRLKNEHKKFVESDIFPVLEKALKSQSNEDLKKAVIEELVDKFSYQELTEAYAQSRKMVAFPPIEDVQLDKSQTVLRVASFKAQHRYFDNVKEDIKQQISIILDLEIDKLHLSEEDKAVVELARKKMDDDQKFFDTIFTKSFKDLKPEENFAYECNAYVYDWEQ